MNQEIKTRWIEALRSGAYEKATGELRSFRQPGHFCCLGVLCDLIDPLGWTQGSGSYEFRGKYGFLPSSIRQQANLSGPEETDLAGMNDGGSSFNEIATYIEENL